MSNKSDNWITIPSQSGFYVLDCPSDWKQSQEDNVLNVFPESQSGAVTVSAFISQDKNPEKLLPIVREESEGKETVKPFCPLQQRGAKGISGIFKDISNPEGVIWYVIGLHTEKVFVFATANVSEKEYETQKAVYENVLSSIVLNDPFEG